jgi:hypothetical protein
MIAFWFCMDNKSVADEEIGSILYGHHRDCTICGAKSIEYEQMFFPKGSGTMTRGRLQSNNGDTYPLASTTYGSMLLSKV